MVIVQARTACKIFNLAGSLPLAPLVYQASRESSAVAEPMLIRSDLEPHSTFSRVRSLSGERKRLAQCFNHVGQVRDKDDKAESHQPKDDKSACR